MAELIALPNLGERARTFLDSVLMRGALPNAVILNGSDENALRKYATYLAAVNACESSGTICGVCEPCRRVLNRITPDVIDIFPDEGKQSINVDQARSIRTDAYIAPNEMDFKVYILHGADKMNVQTQNALLKILEEPPKFVSFILLSSNVAAFLPTVRSRCQLVQIDVVDEKSIHASQFAKLALETVDVLSGNKKSLIIDILSSLPSERSDFKEYIIELMSVFRDIIAFKSGSGDYIFFDNPDLCREYAMVFSENGCIAAYETLYSALNDNSANIYMLLSQTRLMSELWQATHL